jgi:hypothetical protein
LKLSGAELAGIELTGFGLSVIPRILPKFSSVIMNSKFSFV